MQKQISLEQIGLMKHAIGYEKRKVKRNKYEAYRNYFVNGWESDDNWEDLISKEYAIKECRNDMGFIYFVTDEGLKLLENILEIKIVKTR